MAICISGIALLFFCTKSILHQWHSTIIITLNYLSQLKCSRLELFWTLNFCSHIPQSFIEVHVKFYVKQICICKVYASLSISCVCQRCVYQSGFQKIKFQAQWFWLEMSCKHEFNTWIPLSFIVTCMNYPLNWRSISLSNIIPLALIENSKKLWHVKCKVLTISSI